MKMMLLGIQPPGDIYQDDDLAQASALTLVLFIPLAMGFWFAPILAGWHRFPALKSLFFSYFACARNFGALTVYALVLLMLATFMRIVFALLQAVAGDVLAELFALPLFLLLAAVLCASIYVSYRDIFRDDAIAGTPAEPPRP
jgi:hypothetical protein